MEDEFDSVRADNYDDVMLELGKLVALDPDPESDEGRQLLALSEMVMEYEKKFEDGQDPG